MERTCLIIKPDGLGKRVVGEIIKNFESQGFKLVGMKMIRGGREKLEKFYEIHKGKQFFEPFMKFVSSMPVIISVWQGEKAVSRVREIIGATNSREAAKGTLRNLYGTDNRRNLVHASDSLENAKRETEYFFTQDELFDYGWDDWKDK
ncbi:MAG: nucleoside-diphosphate kinase [Endomicrobiales bacterium]|nr:nucleoside-diphosphate kinase [Endomicrobiales bacterium]